ncbi:MFS transporter [Nocardioides sp. ChNu-153]|uniref:MFS transporter n=1 Tax=unclassified Nocardioides TaxID=2615069 RepID=UPI0024068A0D|nr:MULTISPECIES: MFS transporter [unclassified Nocardioides]MDF9717963.1 MFS transporter [Nocardioides sp. ChNu-99]MDN7122998.1 MFS transporter [Nocardioides sp. ChNu-153]
MSADAAAPPTAGRGLGARYRRVLASSAAANLGDGLMVVAVLWLASSLTRDPFVITLLGLASRLPWLVFTLLAGVLTDRVDRRLLVGSMDAVRCVAVALLAAVVALHQASLPTPAELAAGAPAPDAAPLLLVVLGVVSLLLGFAEVLRDNAAQTLLPAVVDRAHLERANGRLWAVESTMNNFVGPPLAGLLLGLALVVPFAANAGLLALSALLVLGLRGDFRPRRAPAVPGVAPAVPDWRRELAEGFGWLWRHRLLRTLAFMLAAMNLLTTAAFVTLVLFVQEVLGVLDGWAFGLVTTGTAVGAVAASLVVDRVVARLGPGPSLLVSVVGSALVLLVTGLTSSPVLFWAMGVVTGLFVVLWNVVTVSLRQRIIPDHLLGRVNSVYRFFGWGMMAVGSLLGGAVVVALDAVGDREWALRAPFLLAAAGHLVLVPVALRRLGTAAIRAAEAEAEAEARG